MNPDLTLKKKKMGKEYKLQILVVDDNPLILMSLSRFLKKIALVKTVSTAEEALGTIKEQHYDLCFLDVFLPGMTGLDAMKIINELSPNTKVAIMTGALLNEAMKEQVMTMLIHSSKNLLLFQILKVWSKGRQLLLTSKPNFLMTLSPCFTLIGWNDL
jgi:CheY-like chemotaxis protein